MSTNENHDHFKKPRIGFVIPAHGSVPLVLKTLDSIQNQSVAPAVVVVVFDGPNEGIREQVEGCSVVDVTIELESASGGPATPRNIGFERIRDRCDAVCFLDHDDIIHPDFIRAATEILHKEPDASLVAFRFENWNHGEPRVDIQSVPTNPIPTTPLELSDYLDATGSVLPSFSVIRNSIEPTVRDSGTFFDACFPSNQDFDSFVRILSQRPGVRCEWKAGWYRVIETSISADGILSWSCRGTACRALSSWFAGRNDHANASNFRRAAATADRRAARHYWVIGKRKNALRMLASNFIHGFDVRDLLLILMLVFGIDSKSRAMSSGDQRKKPTS